MESKQHENKDNKSNREENKESKKESIFDWISWINLKNVPFIVALVLLTVSCISLWQIYVAIINSINSYTCSSEIMTIFDYTINEKYADIWYKYDSNVCTVWVYNLYNKDSLINKTSLVYHSKNYDNCNYEYDNRCNSPIAVLLICILVFTSAVCAIMYSFENCWNKYLVYREQNLLNVNRMTVELVATV